MRFSNIFQNSKPSASERREDKPRDNPQPAIPPAKDLPEDLDARVRLVGEWQLGED